MRAAWGFSVLSMLFAMETAAQDCRICEEKLRRLESRTEKTEIAPLLCGTPGIESEISKADATRFYPIASGDTLWEIAERKLGLGRNYEAIFYYHRHRYLEEIKNNNPHGLQNIKSPDIIDENQDDHFIYIPTDEEIQKFWREVKGFPDPAIVLNDPSSLGNETTDLVDPLEISGSSTVYPLTIRAAECFRRSGYSGIITIESTGSRSGLEDLCGGKSQVANYSTYPLREDMIRAGCRDDDVKALHVAQDALTIVVNQQNPIFRFFGRRFDIEMRQLADVLISSPTWGAAARNLGLQVAEPQPNWFNNPINKYYPTSNSGTVSHLVETVFRDELRGFEDRVERSTRKQAYAEELVSGAAINDEDDRFLIDFIRDDPNGLGFFGFAYFKENPDRLIVAKINGNGPGPIAMNEHRYQLSRPLFILTLGEYARSTPVLCEFLKNYVFSVDNFVRDVGYFNLRADQLAVTREVLDGLCSSN